MEKLLGKLAAAAPAATTATLPTCPPASSPASRLRACLSASHKCQ